MKIVKKWLYDYYTEVIIVQRILDYNVFSGSNKVLEILKSENSITTGSEIQIFEEEKGLHPGGKIKWGLYDFLFVKYSKFCVGYWSVRQITEIIWFLFGPKYNTR